MFRLKPRTPDVHASDLGSNKQRRLSTRDSSLWSMNSASRLQTGWTVSSFAEPLLVGASPDGRRTGSYRLPSIDVSRTGSPRGGAERSFATAASRVATPRRKAERKIVEIGPDDVDYMQRQHEMVNSQGVALHGVDLASTVTSSLDDETFRVPAAPASSRRRFSSVFLTPTTASSTDMKLEAILTSPRCERGWAERFLTGGRGSAAREPPFGTADEYSPPLDALEWMQSSCNAVFPIEEGAEAGRDAGQGRESAGHDQQPVQRRDSERRSEEQPRRAEATAGVKSDGIRGDLPRRAPRIATWEEAARDHPDPDRDSAPWEPEDAAQPDGEHGAAGAASQGAAERSQERTEEARDEVEERERSRASELGGPRARATQSRGRTEALSLGGKRLGVKVLSPRGRGVRQARFLQGSSAEQMWRLTRPKAPPGGLEERRLSRQTKVPWEMAAAERHPAPPPPPRGKAD